MAGVMVSIDKKIPIPARRSGGKPKYPWRAMEVGDSLFIQKPPTQGGGIAGNARRAAGGEWTTREATENGVNGFRIWRTA